MNVLEGQRAPAFKLKGSDGKTHALKDYLGRTVLLYFYPRDHTPGCTKEACGFRDVHDQIGKMNVVVLGVSKDSVESHDTFITEFDLPFVLLSDPDAGMMSTYGAWGEKTLYGKKTIGAIRSTVCIGPDGKVLKHWARVTKADQHPEKVLEWLRRKH